MLLGRTTIPLHRPLSLICGFWLAFLIFLLPEASLAAAPLKIAKAIWSAKKGTLLVTGSLAGTRPDMPVELFDSSGRLLASAASNRRHKFRFKVADDRPELLCSVRVKSGTSGSVKKVAGIRSKDCLKAPGCQILSPKNGAALSAHEDVAFRGKARLKDRKAGPLKLEWDFGGGAQRIYGAEGHTVFERDNNRFRVRFTAWDGKKRYCEDQISVTVGAPPAERPAKVAEQPAPGRGAGLSGDTVVLPFNDMAMQSGYPTYATVYPWESINNLNAQAIRKGSVGDAGPKILTGAEIQLRYSAASNPGDPVGRDSINSTSQDWAPGGDHDHAAGGFRKLDGFWRHGDHAGAVDGGIWWLIFPDSYFNGDYYETAYPPDEGYRSRHNVTVSGEYTNNAHPDSGKGSTMPGIAAPYQANDPQPFNAFLSEAGLFTAEALPLSDIDDQGRVNSFPLMRVEAIDKATGKVLASTDAVVTHGSDMRCRECHLKGGVGADPGVARKPSAFNFHMPTAQLPILYEPAGSDIIALEKTALFNAASLHTWYNMKPWFDKWAKENGGYDANDPKEGIDDSMAKGHSGFACFAHHSSTVAAEFNIQQPMNIDPPDFSPGGDYPPFSKAQHGWHGRLQQDAAGKLLRDENGNPMLWGDGGTENPQNPFTLAAGRNLNTLFPTDGDRPMEDNCLRCHAGKREQLYRDHHYTVGLKCVDCHGDMLAVSQLLARPDGSHRQDWLDQPNCGSCHGGKGSEAVAKRAYDPNDPSATPLVPKSGRFAVRPATVQIRTGNWKDLKMALKDYTSTAFRHSRDSHGNVACAGCHGPGHALWPNRDPKANDNVTALQLQGYPGTLMECRVCHTQDAFAQLASLDAGADMQKAEGLPADSGILGGPHGMHPVNDPNWWRRAAADVVPISDGSTWGGWHDNVYRKPGVDGEDQCAACHGADHKGTRLSKTPVNLEFVVNGGRKARWKAGEVVGCDRCHSLAKSFIGAPK